MTQSISLFPVFMALWGWDFPVCNQLVAFPGIQNIMIMDTGRHRKPMKLMVGLGIWGWEGGWELFVDNFF